MREQVCTYMCPWPRIQAAMTDREALSVTYRRDRGEVRGVHRKGESWEGRGDCIDCKQCVAACPMGIDIRDGAQLECINCALCIDACDDVMTKIGRPLGLIAFDTEANVERRLRGERQRFRFVRPRTILYGAVIAIVGAVMLFTFANRHTLALDVIRDRNPDFVTLADGAVRNGYTLKLMNRNGAARRLTLDMKGVQARKVVLIGLADTRLPATLEVEADKVRTVRLLVTVDRAQVRPGPQAIHFILADRARGETRSADAIFVGGTR
jgi:cytochrome c oxidase accessory protein FixG